MPRVRCWIQQPGWVAPTTRICGAPIARASYRDRALRRWLISDWVRRGRDPRNQGGAGRSTRGAFGSVTGVFSGSATGNGTTTRRPVFLLPIETFLSNRAGTHCARARAVVCAASALNPFAPTKDAQIDSRAGRNRLDDRQELTIGASFAGRVKQRAKFDICR